jgi:drug/metabolite transporter (DMT)-like permease
MSAKQIGCIQIILSGAFFGFLGLFGKIAYQKSILPGELLGLRFLASAIILGTFLYFAQRKAFRMSLKNAIISILLGVLGYAVFSSCYFLALQGISASLTVLLLYTYPVLVAIGAKIFFKEHIGVKGFAALVLSSAGLAGLVWGEWEVSGAIFLIYGLASSFFYAIYILVSRKVLEDISFMGSSFYVQLGAGVALCLLHFKSFDRPLEIYMTDYPLIIGMAVICSLFPLTLFLAGLQKVSPSEASILSTTEPIFGVLVASIFLGERMGLVQIAGGILVLTGMVLIALKPKPRLD